MSLGSIQTLLFARLNFRQIPMTVDGLFCLCSRTSQVVFVVLSNMGLRNQTLGLLLVTIYRK